MDLPGAPGGSGEEHFGGRVVRILLEEMVLVGPDVVEAKTVGDLHLGQRMLDHAVLGPGIPRAWQLQLVNQAEPHGMCLPCASSCEPCRSLGRPNFDPVPIWCRHDR